MAKRTLRPFTFRSDYRLPKTYSGEIGRMIVRWAFLDHQVNTILWGVAFNFDDDSPTLGRLTLAERPLPERLKLIRTLAGRRKVSFDGELLDTLQASLKPLADERNLIAHGTWTKEGRHWFVKQTRGDWTQTGGPTIPKKLLPEAVHRSSAQLRATVAQIDGLIAEVMNLKRSLLSKGPGHHGGME
jgi:hypothetical protein